MHNNIPEQNEPINIEDKVSMSLFKWIMGGICLAALGIFGFEFNYIISLINKVEEKYQTDHDKIIRLETMMELKNNFKKN